MLPESLIRSMKARDFQAPQNLNEAGKGAASLWDSIHSFKFHPKFLWAAGWELPVVAIAVYLLLVWLIKKWVARRGKPFELKWIVVAHNLLTCVGSAALLVFMIAEIDRLRLKFSLWEFLCDPDVRFFFGLHYFYYFLNYLFKFWEFNDTFLLALRGKPTPFLHVYHHASTLLLTWCMMRAQICVQWVPITLNLAVHVIMYLYFALHALGYNVWWRKYLTQLQIVQFVADVVIGMPLLVARLGNEAFGYTNLPTCHGSYEGSFMGLLIIASFLLLFIRFYRQSYKESRSGLFLTSPAHKEDTEEKGEKQKTK